MSKLIFSVLISVYYNESISYFKKSLDSILYQTLLPAEVVLVKDGILTDDLNCIVKE
ncbi:amylovoran biosynthesis protein AmsE, partial [Bacteroides thetaiotaomicron]